MAINDILEIGRQGMAASRKAMETTTNNIANANTPGYTRRKAVLTSNEQGVTNDTMVGGGVEVNRVARVHDDFVQNRILEESRGLGAARMRADKMKALEGIVNNDAFKMTDRVNGFFNAVRELSANPESSTLRTAVAQAADSTAQGFRALNGQLENMKSDIDQKISISVDQINTMTKELAELNGAIAVHTAGRDEPHDLLDRREAILRDLSEKLGYQVSTDDQGHANITAGGLGVLVNGTEAHELGVVRSAEHGDKSAGSVDITLKDPFGERVVTSSVTDGELGGLLHVRDKVINPTLEHLDRAAYGFASAVNDAHKAGVGADGVGGRALFKAPETVKGASGTIDLSSDVKASPDAIAIGVDPMGPGDNRIALAIADLQNKPLVPARADRPAGSSGLGATEGNEPKEAPAHTLNDSLNNLVGNVAVQVRHDDEMARHQEAIMEQLNNHRESISGVNLEEEGINLVQQQTLFNAAAKAMRVGDEMFKTILSIKD